MNFHGIKDPESTHKLNLIHLDIEIPKVNLCIQKPFIERLSIFLPLPFIDIEGSMNEFLSYDLETEKWKTSFNVEKNHLLYDKILRKKVRLFYYNFNSLFRKVLNSK